MQVSAEETFNESTKSYSYDILPLRGIANEKSECLYICGDTPEPSEPIIIIIFLSLKLI